MTHETTSSVFSSESLSGGNLTRAAVAGAGIGALLGAAGCGSGGLVSRLLQGAAQGALVGATIAALGSITTSPSESCTD